MAERDRELAAEHFLNLIRDSKRGKFKLYIGMAAGVGKTYRMLQEAHSLLRNGINVQVGYIETHQRAETEALVAGLPMVPRRSAFYKGKRLDELDMQAVINLHPEVVLIDELAHSNVPGSRNEKRWQDVSDILEAGINVISAVNIQHIESLNGLVKEITGVEVAERIPDKMLKLADEVVNIDLTAGDLIARLKEGRIYTKDKIALALNNFFKSESILQLRELALKEVAGQIERKVETEVPKGVAYRHEHLLTCISGNHMVALKLIRKSARLAGYYNAQWTVLYVETPRERPDRIPLDRQRRLINNFKLAGELGARIERIKGSSTAESIAAFAEAHNITTVCIGKPRLTLLSVIIATSVFNSLLKRLAHTDTDLIILS
jgi:two-component system sensor histidine kinase KdpD